jgi:hypothetical protein
LFVLKETRGLSCPRIRVFDYHRVPKDVKDRHPDIPARGSDLLVPAANAREDAVIDSFAVRPVNHLSGIVEFLNGRSDPEPFKAELDGIWNACISGGLNFQVV